MRVLHFVLSDASPNAANGLDRALFEIARCQAQQGATVAVFGLTLKSPTDIPGCLMRTFTPEAGLFRLPDALKQAILEWKPDVIQTHSVYTPQLTALQRWAFAHDIPYVCTTQGTLHPNNETHGRLKKRIYKRLLQLPDFNRALFVHTSTQYEALPEYGIRAPIVYAPNGIDYSRIPQPLNTRYWVDHYPELEGKRIYLFLGRLEVFQKGLDILFAAFGKARPANSKLVLVGPMKTEWDDCEPEIRRLMVENQIENDVLLPGALFEPDKFHAFASADVLLYPSRWEATALSVLEAAACGLPAVVSQAASLDRVLPSSGAAIETPLEADAWADAIRHMAGISKAQLIEMGACGAQAVRAHFSWEATAATLLEAYRAHLEPHAIPVNLAGDQRS